MKTPKEIKEFLNNKVLVNINFDAKEIISGNTPKVETISIDDFLEWFESGVLIPNEFFYLKIDNYSWVIQFKEFTVNDINPISYYYMLKMHNNTLNYDDSCDNNGWIKATPAQKQLLIDKVQEQTGKVWNENTKMFEGKPNDIVVPDNIKIVKHFTDMETPILGLVFNEGKQILNYRIEYKCYEVYPCIHSSFNEIKCKLIPTLFQDLEVGDLFYNNSIESQQRLVDIRNYKIKIENTDTISIRSNNSIILDSCYNMQSIVYKLIPIK